MATLDNPIDYFIGDELDSAQFWWFSNGALVDLSVTHTYSAKLIAIGDATNTNVFASAKSTGFTGAAGSGTKLSGTPNLTVTWATSGELNDVVTEGVYTLRITATRSSDSKQRTSDWRINLKAR